MTGLAWLLTGVGISAGTGLVAALAIDRDLRSAAVRCLAALVLGPAILLIMAFIRRGPSLLSLSPEALGRFCRQVDADMQPAWVLSYGGRGVILVRRRSASWWRNNVPSRAADAAGK